MGVGVEGAHRMMMPSVLRWEQHLGGGAKQGEREGGELLGAPQTR